MPLEARSARLRAGADCPYAALLATLGRGPRGDDRVDERQFIGFIRSIKQHPSVKFVGRDCVGIMLSWDDDVTSGFGFPAHALEAVVLRLSLAPTGAVNIPCRKTGIARRQLDVN